MDREAFRARFKAYKEGKPVSEIYDAGLPKYWNGKLTKQLMAMLDHLYEWGNPLGYDLFSIAGIGGNGLQESGLNPNIVSKWGYSGLFQNNKSLTNAIIDMYGDNSLLSLLKYVDEWNNASERIRKGKHAAWTAMNAGKFKKKGYTSATDAANAWMKFYERPVILDANGKLIGYQQLDKRIAYANAAYDYLFSKYGNPEVLKAASQPIVALQYNTRVVTPTPQYILEQTHVTTLNNIIPNRLLLLQPVRTKSKLGEELFSMIFENDEPEDGILYAKNGKLPRYGGGKDGYRYIKNDETGGWDRITNDDEANLMSDLVVTPRGIRNKFDYESNPNYVAPRLKNEVVKQDNDLWTRQQVEKANDTRTWRSDIADALHAVGEGAMLASMFAGPEVEPLVYPAYNAAKAAIAGAFRSNTPAMQYLRYPVGKFIYGLDALFPTLYRKIKALPTEPQDGIVQISNPGNRFVFSNTREESPIITNFTYDAPVRRHASGNWDSGYTIAMPGKKVLLGKNVISTEPSDLFTYGDNILVPLKNIKLISGDIDEINAANKYGYDVVTSPKLQLLYEAGDSKGVSFTIDGGKKFNLRKQELSGYAKEVENMTRQLFKSPTKKDVDFMNFVLLPKIKGRIYDPTQLDYLIREGIEPFGDRIGNAQLREYLLDPTRWENILYDPATHAESMFRDEMGITLKRGYKDGKSPIHIKPANRGKLTRLKARTGKSESELYNDGNPAHKKMVVFARSSRKWHKG